MQTTITNNTIFAAYFTNVNTGYFVGGNSNGTGIILKTTDAGTNWIDITYDTAPALYSIYFSDINTGYAVGLNGCILKTSNAGLTWVKQVSNTNNYLTSAFFTTSDVGYVARYNGTILKTTIGEDQSYIHPVSGNENMLVVYPNPVNGRFTIEYCNPENELIDICLLDLDGKTIIEIKSIQEKFELNGKDLQNGIYLVKVRKKYNVFIKKIIKE